MKCILNCKRLERCKNMLKKYDSLKLTLGHKLQRRAPNGFNKTRGTTDDRCYDYAEHQAVDYRPPQLSALLSDRSIT